MADKPMRISVLICTETVLISTDVRLKETILIRIRCVEGRLLYANRWTDLAKIAKRVTNDEVINISEEGRNVPATCK
jgi:hypothetical protein